MKYTAFALLFLFVSSRGAFAVSPMPFPERIILASPDGPREAGLMMGYYESLRDWGRVVSREFRPVPGRPGQGYYGLPRNVEDDVRPITYAVLVNAFLSRVAPPGEGIGVAERACLEGEAVAALRYLCAGHVTGGSVCLNGKPWGDQWQSAMWSAAAGLGAWIIFDKLDASLRESVVSLVVHEADRFIHQKPKSSEWRDTGAEENAWNAMIVSLAASMLPEHPRAAQWDGAAKRYLYNAFSVAADAGDTNIGDDGRRVCDWVSTVNAHPDYTVENHGLVHVGYLRDTLCMMLQSAVLYEVGGREAPRAAFHHVGEAWNVMLAAMSHDGAPVYFGGNDWKIIHTQPVDVSIYATLALLRDDPVAARLEEIALDRTRAIQRAEGGFYNVRRDLEYGGLCTTLLISAYMARAAGGGGATPLSDEELDRRLHRVSHLEYARAILHRAPDRFVSFSWGPKRIALAQPRNGGGVVWPHFASGMGYINGQDASERYAKLDAIEYATGEDCFAVAGRLLRHGGGATQEFAFVSRPGGVVVYMERLRAAPGFELRSRETGVVGHEYPLGENTRVLYGRHGETRVVGTGNEAGVRELATDWLNLGGVVGYVVRRSAERENVMRYHDLTQGEGRVPKLQEWFSLIGDPHPAAWSADGDAACLVTFLNQSPAETERWSGRVEFTTEADAAVCRVGDEVVRVNWLTLESRVETAR